MVGKQCRGGPTSEWLFQDPGFISGTYLTVGASILYRQLYLRWLD